MIKYKLFITLLLFIFRMIVSVQCKHLLQLTNDMIENRLLLEINKIINDPSFYESLNSPVQGIKGEWNDSILTNDISRHYFREVILDSLDSTTGALNQLDALGPLNGQDDSLITQRHLPSMGDLSTLFTSSFVCQQSERQLAFLQDDSARVCCNSRSGETRSCHKHRCRNQLTTARNSNGTVVSGNCCETKKSLRLCPGSFSEVFDIGQSELKECVNRNAFIDVKSNAARICCVSSSMCTRNFQCAKIVQRTSVRDTSNRFLCCQPYSSMSYYCSAASQSAVIVSPQPSPTTGGPGPVNPGYYSGPPPPPPPPPPPVVNPTGPGIYPPPTGPYGQPPTGPFRPLPGRPCLHARYQLSRFYSNVTSEFINVSKSLHNLRSKVLFTASLDHQLVIDNKFSNISNQLVRDISLLKEKQAYISRSNRKLGIKVKWVASFLLLLFVLNAVYRDKDTNVISSANKMRQPVNYDCFFFFCMRARRMTYFFSSWLITVDALSSMTMSVDSCIFICINIDASLIHLQLYIRKRSMTQSLINTCQVKCAIYACTLCESRNHHNN